MVNKEVYEQSAGKFHEHFRRNHTVAAYAPGRVEVLGNHTDYNEGFVLSAAINLGTFFLAAPSGSRMCRVLAGDRIEEDTFDISSPAPSKKKPWSNYVKGVFAKLSERKNISCGFLGLLLSNIPIGAGLSSSAALEVSAGLALSDLYRIKIGMLDLARIGQAAEHEYAGVKCGLLDQISSLFARENELVISDFRALEVKHVPLAKDARFIMCNSSARHTLTSSAYNERRKKCEMAAKFFASVLKHPVKTLRDVSWREWESYSRKMDSVTAKRSAHIIGENARVLKGKDLLIKGKLEDFGKLMYESHESSRVNYQNSCPELDFIVSTAKKMPGALGARLSGGGFGGSAVILAHARDVNTISEELSAAYQKRFRHPCDIRVITPSRGAHLC
jgi:galactokinase